ncbi:MAG: 2,3-bisphosphoglycerate-independent phosphoglycerate mutase [Oscillospiraceae bacterium]
MKKPLVLMILDGFGHSEEIEGNAIENAKTPVLDKLFAENPHTLIGASGLDVGLPDGQMGNSEVGHTNIGAGRVVYQELTRITKAITDGVFFKNEAFLHAMKNAAKEGRALHIMGLLSDGGVHSTTSHLFALIDMAKANNVKKLYIHAILDGRDTPPQSGKAFVEELAVKLREAGVGQIATVCGRYYAMDRDNRYERLVKAYGAYVLGEGNKCSDPAQSVQNSYDDGVNDEFVLPVVCVDGAEIKADDSVIFYNFRPDRAREITRVFVDPDFKGFERAKGYFPLTYVSMTEYDTTIPNVEVAFKPDGLANTFGEYIGERGLTQLRIAETEKYAHVTFFFNGGNETPYKGEERVLIKSPSVATYDLQPEMSAYLVTDAVVDCIKSGKYDVIILNFANCDMVGHTGVYEAAVLAVEAVDKCVGRVCEAVKSMDGTVLLTADHGNADKMYDDDKKPFTAHTTNPVPFRVIGKQCSLSKSGKLADIAPTMLRLLGLSVPPEMSGESLIV